MERISIFNYEAFYLDHLEGNLNEEDTALLLNFLSDHPELALEFEDLPTLSLEEEESVVPSFEHLKQIDYDNDVISISNLETFAIAHSEKQLSAKKELELTAFISKNEEAKELVAVYNSVKLIADTTVVFDQKASLKRRTAIPLWRYAAIAASIVGVVFAVQVWNSNGNSINSNVVAFDFLDNRFEDENLRVISSGNNGSNNHAYEASLSEVPNNGTISPQNLSIQKKPSVVRKADNLQFAHLEKRKPQMRVDHQQDDIRIVEHPLHPVNQSADVEPTIAVAYNDMHNPIKPITNRLSEFTQKEIDLRTAKATEERKGGFYLKIGSLEIDHPGRKVKNAN